VKTGPDLRVEGRDQDMVVTMPGTSLRVYTGSRIGDRSSWRGASWAQIGVAAQSLDHR
jgi:hypothetical protein